MGKHTLDIASLSDPQMCQRDTDCNKKATRHLNRVGFLTGHTWYTGIKYNYIKCKAQRNFNN